VKDYFLIAITVLAAVFIAGCQQPESSEPGNSNESAFVKLEMISVTGATVTGGRIPGVNEERGPFITGRTVTLSDYKLSKYQTTYAQWKAVYDWAVQNGYTFANSGSQGWPPLSAGGTADPAYWSQEQMNNRPAMNINWRDAVVWCNALSEMEGLTPVYYLAGNGGGGHLIFRIKQMY